MGSNAIHSHPDWLVSLISFVWGVWQDTSSARITIKRLARFFPGIDCFPDFSKPEGLCLSDFYKFLAVPCGGFRQYFNQNKYDFRNDHEYFDQCHYPNQLYRLRSGGRKLQATRHRHRRVVSTHRQCPVASFHLWKFQRHSPPPLQQRVMRPKLF